MRRNARWLLRPTALRIKLKYGDLQQRVLTIKNFFGELK